MTEQFWHKNVSNEDIGKVKKAFKESFVYPTLVEASIAENSDVIESKWSYIDVSDSSKKTFLRTSNLNVPFNTSR